MTGTTPAAPEPPQVGIATVRRAVAASALGNAMEWYDYGVFTSGALAGAIGGLFFPGDSNEAIKTFALLAVSFVVRPFGGFFFGPLGDKLGRQRVLALTVLLMAGGTTLVGVLPTYAGPYSAGVGALVLVVFLRLIQGFSTGGEYGGAATFMAEYSPVERRGFFGSFLEFGTLTGYVIGNAVVLAVALPLGAHSTAFVTWGWRIPFLFALPLGLVGFYLRIKLEDTPTFRALDAAGGRPEKAPLKETLTGHWQMILNLVGIVLLLNVADYLVLTKMPNYLTDTLHIGDTTTSLIVIGVELGQMAVIAPLGALSDRVGRKPLLLTSAIGYILLSYPAFRLMELGSLASLVVGYGIVAFLLVLILAVIGSTFPAMFPTRVRYGSFSIGYNISTAAFGGTASLLVSALIKVTGITETPPTT
jgi:MHS family proline/betaine transporter-like MFS transporter